MGEIGLENGAEINRKKWMKIWSNKWFKKLITKWSKLDEKWSKNNR